MGAVDGSGREPAEIVARGLGGGSFFGQAAKSTGISNTSASTSTFRLLIVISSVRFVHALDWRWRRMF
jgi:hypothetical protein